MSWLSLLLIVKIGVTALLVAVPFLILPKSFLEKSTEGLYLTQDADILSSVWYRHYRASCRLCIWNTVSGEWQVSLGCYMHGNRIQRRSRCRTYGILAWQQSESSAISFFWTHSFRVSGSNDPTSQRNSEGMVVMPPNKAFKADA